MPNPSKIASGGERASRILAAILDTATQTLDVSYKFAFSKVDGREDVLELALDDEGHFNAEKAADNISSSRVNYNISQPFIKSLSRSNIPVGWATYLEPAKSDTELAKPYTYVYYAKEDQALVKAVIDEYTQHKYFSEELEPEELLRWIRSHDGDTSKVACLQINDDLYDYMKRNGQFTGIPRAEVDRDESSHSVKIAVPNDYYLGLTEVKSLLETQYTGRYRQVEKERISKTNEALERAVSNAKNDLYESIIVNKSNPAEYIRLNKDGYVAYIDTNDGPNPIARANRSDRDYEQKFYNNISSYHGLLILEGTEPEREKKLHDAQEKGLILQPITVEDRAFKLKQEYVESITHASELVVRTYKKVTRVAEEMQLVEKGRLLDDAIKINNRIDSLRAIGLGLSAEAGDLGSDLAHLKRISASMRPSEMSKDLSDLYAFDKNGWEDYLSEKLCLKECESSYRTKVLGEYKEMIESVTKESEEVQKTFRKEFDMTIGERFSEEYWREGSNAIEYLDLQKVVTERTREAEIDFERI